MRHEKVKWKKLGHVYYAEKAKQIPGLSVENHIP